MYPQAKEGFRDVAYVQEAPVRLTLLASKLSNMHNCPTLCTIVCKTCGVLKQLTPPFALSSNGAAVHKNLGAPALLDQLDLRVSRCLMFRPSKQYKGVRTAQACPRMSPPHRSRSCCSGARRAAAARWQAPVEPHSQHTSCMPACGQRGQCKHEGQHLSRQRAGEPVVGQVQHLEAG